MSGLGELGELPGFTPGMGGQVSQADLDQYDQVTVNNPAVDASWFGTASGTNAGVAIGKLNQLADWPRNPVYSINGITNGTYGGTFTVNWLDQFGVAVQEKVAIGTAVNGGTTFGSLIAAKFISGTFQAVASAGTFIGTARIGAGTTENGSAQSNWFGLLTKIAGTADVKNITWINNGTPTVMNVGTSIGTLVNTTLHAFQGTSGVALTDTLRVTFKPLFDNNGKGTLSAL